MIKVEGKKLLLHLKNEISTFSFANLQSRRATRCAFSVTLAAFISFVLHADLPFWACITAIVVTEKSTGESLWKCVQRIIATVSGAVTGLVAGLCFSDHTLFFCFFIFLVASLGMYMMNIHKSREYIWMLGSLTCVMVMLLGLDNPSSAHFTDIAFYRSFEVVIGIFSSFLSSLFIFPENLVLEEKQAIANIYRQLSLCVDDFIKGCSQSYNPLCGKAGDSKSVNARNLRREMAQLFARIEPIKREQRLFGHKGVNIEFLLHSAKYISVTLLPENIPGGLPEKYNIVIGHIHTGFRDAFAMIVKLVENQETKKNTLKSIQNLITTIKKAQAQFIQHKTMDEYIFCFLSILFQRVAENMLLAVSGKLIKKEKHRTFAISQRKIKHDFFLVRFALVHALAILTVPFFWLFFNFPEFSQVAISIAASVSFSGENTRYKGFQRLSGCFFGCIFALFFLWLEIDTLSAYLIVLLAFCYGLLYFRMGKPEVSYFGMQSTIVLITGCVAGLSPAVSIEPSLERLAGIFFGVFSLVSIQGLFWRVSEYDNVRHIFKQIKQSLYIFSREADTTTLMTLYHPEMFSLETELSKLEQISSQDSGLSMLAKQMLAAYEKVYINIFSLSLVKDSLTYRHQIYEMTLSLLRKMLSSVYLSIKDVEKMEQKLAGIKVKLYESGAGEKKEKLNQIVINRQLSRLIENIQLCLDCYRGNINYGLEQAHKTFTRKKALQ